MFEQSLPLVLLGVIITALLAGGWLQTGRRLLLVGAVIVLLLTIAVVVIERYVVTDREAVEETLHQIAKHLEQNDVEAIASHVHPQAIETIALIRSEVPRYTFSDVTIKSNLEIEVDVDAQPPEATARFNASVTASERQGLFSNQRIPRYVIVLFKKDQDGRWRVFDYEHREPQAGFLQSPDGL